jgi:mRNA-degrading endonuclease toxin of MazEF toxin-antitoxin module
MRAWEIWTGDIFGPHPCVIVSNQKRLDRKEHVVVLKCQTLRPGITYDPGELETVLDKGDGLELKTRCTCDLMFTVEKRALKQKRGEVQFERRRDISRKMIQGLALAGL